MIGGSDAAAGDDCGAHGRKKRRTQPSGTLWSGVGDLCPQSGRISPLSSAQEVPLIGQQPSRRAFSHSPQPVMIDTDSGKPHLCFRAVEHPLVVSEQNL